MEIGEFIAARLDEEERGARAATLGPWMVDNPTSGRWQIMAAADDDPSVEQMVALSNTIRRRGDDDARHIARQDPAATLARMEALRALVGLHGSDDAGPFAVCCACGPGDEAAPFPCATLRQIAAIWRDHSDWQEGWAP